MNINELEEIVVTVQHGAIEVGAKGFIDELEGIAFVDVGQDLKVLFQGQTLSDGNFYATFPISYVQYEKVDTKEYLEKLSNETDYVGSITFGDFKDMTSRQAEKILSTFHANKYKTLELDDDMFAGIRANHFVIEIGDSEELVIDKGDGDDSIYQPMVYVVSANHKGIRMSNVFVEKGFVSY